MAHKPQAFDPVQRELRQRTYQAASTIAKKFPAAGEIAIDLRFSDPDRKQFFSPYKRIFSPGMQAFFTFQCPDKTCNGGFDIGEQITVALSNKRASNVGVAQCQARKKRSGVEDSGCLLELKFEIATLQES